MSVKNQRMAITGHRLERIPDLDALRVRLHDIFLEFSPQQFIQGMANGVDLNSAVVALKQNLPVLGAKPWAGHTPRKEDEHMYRWVEKRSQIVDVNDAKGFPGNWAYQKRNEYMVNNADMLLAVWDGKPKGGTFNCLKYALKVGVPVYHLDLNDLNGDLQCLSAK